MSLFGKNMDHKYSPASLSETILPVRFFIGVLLLTSVSPILWDQKAMMVMSYNFLFHQVAASAVVVT